MRVLVSAGGEYSKRRGKFVDCREYLGKEMSNQETIFT